MEDELALPDVPKTEIAIEMPPNGKHIRRNEEVMAAERMLYHRSRWQRYLAVGDAWRALVASYERWRDARDLLGHYKELGKRIFRDIGPMLEEVRQDIYMKRQHVVEAKAALLKMQLGDVGLEQAYEKYKMYGTNLCTALDTELNIEKVVLAAIAEKQIIGALYGLHSFVNMSLIQYSVADVGELVDGYQLRTDKNTEMLEAMKLPPTTSSKSAQSREVGNEMIAEFPHLAK